MAPDDLVAIALLLASPGIEVEAVTVSGTGDCADPEACSQLGE